MRKREKLTNVFSSTSLSIKQEDEVKQALQTFVSRKLENMQNTMYSNWSEVITLFVQNEIMADLSF